MPWKTKAKIVSKRNSPHRIVNATSTYTEPGTDYTFTAAPQRLKLDDPDELQKYKEKITAAMEDDKEDYTRSRLAENDLDGVLNAEAMER